MPRVPARPVAPAWASRSPVISWKHMADASGWKAQWERDRAFTSAYPLPLELHFAEFTCSSLRRNLYRLRLADHATNIAEDIIFWVRGLDVRHGHAANLNAQAAPLAENS